MSRASIAIAVALLTSTAGGAVQQPAIGNGSVTTQPAGSPFVPSFQTLVASQPDASWIGYAVPVVDSHRATDSSDCCDACRLEPSGEQTRSMSGALPSRVVKLEGAEFTFVLFRITGRRVERVRVFPGTCELDAGGRPVTWIEGVRPADSIALLESLVTSSAAAGEPGASGSRAIGNGAIAAIALHADAAADAALERLVAPGQPETVRTKVPFWLGNARGRRGLEVLSRLLRDDRSPELQKKAVFGISQSREADATGKLVETARTATHAGIRGEAIFWLAQKAGSRAAADIKERIDNDPDTEVKKRAVFALSQLPANEGVPLLITLARTHTNPAVRKQAMFWLGQSKDPRAIDLFAEILK